VLDEVKRLVAALRQRWPKTEIVLRGDSGLCEDEVMTWCETQKGVYYLFGLAQNARLLREIVTTQEQAKARCEQTGKAARVFTEFRYATLTTWRAERRVIAKAEHLLDKAHPRFVVTSLPEWEVTWDEQVVWNDARTLYEKLYCARGEREHRIKEQPLDLFADIYSLPKFLLQRVLSISIRPV
jgi:hypothetical protein